MRSTSQFDVGMNGTVGVDDLTDLWNAGAVSLPTVGKQYSSAASNLHNAQYYGLEDSGRFDRTEHGVSPVWAPFHELAVLLQDKVMVKSAENCESAGKVLVQIAESMATTDHLNGQELKQYENFKSGIRNGANPPPGDVPDAPSSDDPHPQDDVAGPGDFKGQY